MANGKITAKVHPDDTKELEMHTSDMQMPTPTDCKIFEEIMPWSFERFMVQYEKETTFRHEITNKALDAEVKIWNKWMNYWFILWMSWIFLSWFFAYIGYSSQALIVIITEISTIVWAFIYVNKWWNNKQLPQKKDESN